MRPTTLTVGPCRISYPNLFKAKTSTKFPAQGARFSCDILIPKNSPMVQSIMAAVEAAKTEAMDRLGWNAKMPKNLKMPLADGDEYDDENYHGHWILRPWSKEDRPPRVIDMQLQPILDQTEVYGGMWANVNVNFYAYDNSGAGIGCGFDAGVQKVKDDEPFGGGRTSAEDAFGAPVAPAPQAFTQPQPQAYAQPQAPINPMTGMPYTPQQPQPQAPINPLTGMPYGV